MREENKKIFVGGIPVKVTRDEFLKYFEQFGKVRKVILLKNQNNKAENCGYGFVDFEEPGIVKSIMLSEQKSYLRAKEVRLKVRRSSCETKKIEKYKIRKAEGEE